MIEKYLNTLTCSGVGLKIHLDIDASDLHTRYIKDMLGRENCISNYMKNFYTSPIYNPLSKGRVFELKWWISDLDDYTTGVKIYKISNTATYEHNKISNTAIYEGYFIFTNDYTRGNTYFYCENICEVLMILIRLDGSDNNQYYHDIVDLECVLLHQLDFTNYKVQQYICNNTHHPKYDIIDISKYNNSIDWKIVKAMQIWLYNKLIIKNNIDRFLLDCSN